MCLTGPWRSGCAIPVLVERLQRLIDSLETFCALHFWQQQDKTSRNVAAKLTLLVDQLFESLYPARIIIAGGHNHGPLSCFYSSFGGAHKLNGSQRCDGQAR